MTATDQLERYGIAACAHERGTVLIRARDALTGELVALELDPDEARHFNYELAGAYYRAQRLEEALDRVAA